MKSPRKFSKYILIICFLLIQGFTIGNAANDEGFGKEESNQSESITDNPLSTQQINIPTVKIGNQVWMTQNLNTSTFRNGDPIPQASTKRDWDAYSKFGQAAWCYYEYSLVNDNIYIGETFSATIPIYGNNTKCSEKYGKLYNWYAINDPRGIAPIGFHVPSDDEWNELIDYLGGSNIAGRKMKNNTEWFNEGNGTNSSRFSALPGGFRDRNCEFNFLGLNGGWWSSSDFNTLYAWGLNIFFNSEKVFRENFFKGNGFSVRCLRD